MKKLSYDRPEPTLELKDEPYDEVKPAESFCVNLPRETDLVAEYRAGEPTRETSLIFVVSGGEKRERDYLLELVRTRNNSYRKCVNVVFTSPANDTYRHRGSSQMIYLNIGEIYLIRIVKCSKQKNGKAL